MRRCAKPLVPRVQYPLHCCKNVKGTVPYCMIPVRYLISMFNTSTGSNRELFVISVIAVVFQLNVLSLFGSSVR